MQHTAYSTSTVLNFSLKQKWLNAIPLAAKFPT